MSTRVSPSLLPDCPSPWTISAWATSSSDDNAAPDQQRPKGSPPEARRGAGVVAPSGALRSRSVAAPLPLRPGESSCSFPFVMVAVLSLRPSFIFPPQLYGGACVNVKTADVVYGLAPPDGVVTVMKNDSPMVVNG